MRKLKKVDTEGGGGEEGRGGYWVLASGHIQRLGDPGFYYFTFYLKLRYPYSFATLKPFAESSCSFV